MADELPAPAAEPVVEAPAAETPPAPTPEDVAFEEKLSEHAIDIPDGEKLVPLSELTSAVRAIRGELKEAKRGSAEAAELRTRLSEAESRLRETAPLAEAFRSLQAAQQPKPAEPTGPTPQDIADLEDIARDFDFYKPDGTLDTARAAKVRDREHQTAARIAQQSIAPLQVEALKAQAAANLARAKASQLHGETVDPTIIDGLAAHLLEQPGGLQTLANPQTMPYLLMIARGAQASAPRTAPVPAATAKQAPPVQTEAAGGKVSGSFTLTSLDKAAAKKAGLSEREYQELAAKMPW